MKHFHLAAVAVNGTAINQIVDQSIDPGLQELLQSYDGQVDPTFSAILTAKTTLSFTTTALALALGVCGLNPVGFEAAESDDPIDFYFQPAEAFGTRDTSTCVKMSVPTGMLCMDSIEGAENAAARAMYRVYPVSTDGVAAAVTITTGESLPSLVTTRQEFTLGPAKFNGTAVGGLKQWSLQMNNDIQHDTDSGAAYPTLAYLLARSPKFTMRATDVDVISTIGLFAAQSATDSVYYLRKIAEGGTRVANGTASHISFTVDAGMMKATRAGGSHGQPQMAELEQSVTYDGSSAVVAISTSAAIA